MVASLRTSSALAPVPFAVHAVADPSMRRWVCLAALEPLPDRRQQHAAIPAVEHARVDRRVTARSGTSLWAAARNPWRGALQALLTAVSIVSLVVIAGAIVLSIGPRFAPFETYIVLSGSMEPLIHVGSVEVVRPVPPETLRVGDVITYRRIEEPDITVTHRITQITPADAGTLLRTKGDVNEAEDPWEVQLRGVAWKHVCSVPSAGYVFAFGQTPAGRLLTLALPATTLAALWLHEIWRGKRN